MEPGAGSGFVRGRRVIGPTGLRPNLIQQARQPESSLRQLMTREHVGLVQVRRVQLDGMPRGIDAYIERGLAWLDRDVQRAVDIRARKLIRFPRDIVRGNPRVG